MTDHFCHELFSGVAEMLCFPVSRLVCDVERFRDDADEPMAKVVMGAVYSRCADGSSLRITSEKEREEILGRYYDPHHIRFSKAVKDRLKAFDHCLIVDGHSFYSAPLPYELDLSPCRPDICVGTDTFHTPSVLVEWSKCFFENAGFSVCVNRPFAGSIVPIRYYQKEKAVLSIMIEINRKLYLDDDGEKTVDYARIEEIVRSFLNSLEKLG